MPKQILAIGCTGMLRQTIISLLKDGDMISITGRNQARLDSFDNEHSEFKDQTQLINIDYSSKELFIAKIEACKIRFDICICWMHSHSSNAKNHLFRYLVESNPNIKIFEVSGSSMATPSKSIIKSYPKTKKIILGFQIEGSKSRWLTHQEIATGTYQAIKSGQNETIIGVTEPWNKRP